MTITSILWTKQLLGDVPLNAALFFRSSPNGPSTNSALVTALTVLNAVIVRHSLDQTLCSNKSGTFVLHTSEEPPFGHFAEHKIRRWNYVGGLKHFRSSPTVSHLRSSLRRAT